MSTGFVSSSQQETKKDGSPRTLSFNDKSRLNLCSHMQSQHPGLLDALKKHVEIKLVEHLR